MKNILYATGNAIKFQQAEQICKPAGITLSQTSIDIPEIQGEDGKLIARDKAEKAFAALQKPLVISDDNWTIPGLNGFPGAYMKSINTWFTPEDWLRLTLPLPDRRIVLRQIVVYRDAIRHKVFVCDIEGTLLRHARGTSPYPHSTIVSFDGGASSNAEHHEQGKAAATHRQNAWHLFAEWYSNLHGQT